MAGETIVLDPSAVATGRTQLDITSYVAAAGPNWGDAEIQAYMADQRVGSTTVDYRLPNRTITIPLVLRTLGATTFATIRSSLQQKVGLFQRQQGWIMRQVSATNLYANIVTATLHLGGAWLQTYRDADVDAVLTLECVPDWYGDEITLSDHVETTLPHLFFTETTVNGNYPGRVRVVMDNDSSTDQHGLLWGFRSQYYNAGTTAALFYEAEQLLPLNAAAGAALAGASGGTVITQGSLPANAWVSILSASMMPGTTPLTHNGSYRVWARCYAAGSATPSFRLQWGVGSLSTPSVNKPIQLPGATAFYMLDLGEIRLDPLPVGPNQSFGAIQTQAQKQGDAASIDCVYFQPYDDGAGKIQAVQVASPALVTSVNLAGAGSDDSSRGAVAWTSPGLITALGGASASAVLTAGQESHYLKALTFNLNVPSTATISGIRLDVAATGQPNNAVDDGAVRLVKAGTIQTGERARGDLLWYGQEVFRTYGGPTDLWGTTWTASDVNNVNFGAAITATAPMGVGATALVDAMQITVYYTLASGLSVAADAVIAASKTIELRTDGMFRQGGGGTVYGPAAQVIGDLPRVPPSGLEGRTLQVFLKASRGEFANEPDSGIDDVSAKIIYRPSYLFTP